MKHHQFLTPEIGHPKLQEHIYALMALLKASGLDRVQFEDMVDIALPRHGHTTPISFDSSSQPLPVQAKKFNKSLKGLLNVPPPQKDNLGTQK